MRCLHFVILRVHFLQRISATNVFLEPWISTTYFVIMLSNFGHQVTLLILLFCSFKEFPLFESLISTTNLFVECWISTTLFTLCDFVTLFKEFRYLSAGEHVSGRRYQVCYFVFNFRHFLSITIALVQPPRHAWEGLRETIPSSFSCVGMMFPKVPVTSAYSDCYTVEIASMSATRSRK